MQEPSIDEAVARFATNLRMAREAVGLTQEKLAWECGLAQSEVTRIESGLRSPRIDTVVKLARGLDIDVSELFEGVR